jgi:hypothetical protein
VARRWPAIDRDGAGAGDRSIWLDLRETGGPGGDAVPFLALETLTEPSAGSAVPQPTGERPGHHLLAFRIHRDQRAAWEARLANAGVVISHRSDYTLYFQDPEGNRLGLSHHPHPASGV